MIAVLLSSLALYSQPELKLPAVFSDHMVIQRNRGVRVWGWGKPGSKVIVHAGWVKGPSSTIVEPNGEWSVAVAGAKAGGPYSMTVEGDATVTFKDILLGDVWVCSGQSNMEFTVAATDHAAEDIARATNPKVRLFHLKKAMRDTPQLDCEGTWNVCSPESVANFSAAGYFFGKEVCERTGVPIGLVDTTWGGTEAELWTSEGTLLQMPDFAAKVSQKAKLLADYQAKYSAWLDAAHAKDPGWGKWDGSAIDETGWTPVAVLEPWSRSELKSFDGSVWYRGTLDASEENLEAGSSLDVGVIDDDDETWVNGVKIGETQGWDQHRVYKSPDRLLRPGKNTVVVRVVDTAGEGGWSSGPPSLVNPGGIRKDVTGWRYHKGAAAQDVPAPPQYTAPNNSRLYNGMISPLVRNAIKGAVWYQGESNVSRAFQYRTLFPAMIRDWRKQWGQNFPFYFVQIAPFSGYGSAAGAELREAQFLTLKLNNTGMVVVTDATGNLADIHPKDKRTVGHRLALWALVNEYGFKDLECSGPLYTGKRVQGSTVRVAFSHANGLVFFNGDAKEFEIAGADQVFHPAKAKVEGKTVVVWSDEVPKPVAVRMGWNAAPQPNLVNSAGLPASPFRTDIWPGLTDKAKW